MQRSFRLTQTLLVALTVLASTAASAQTLDAGFGVGGKVLTSFDGVSDGATAVAVQPDGKILAAGFASNGTNTKFAMARYNADGRLDGGFGVGGRIVTDFSSATDFATSVAVQADGRIIAGGYVNGDFGLVRYEANGALDRTFGTGGRVTTSFGAVTQGAASVAIQADRKIVAAGSANLDGTFQFALARYNPDGSPDLDFGKNGRVTGTDFDLVGQGFSFAVAHAVAIQPDGKIVAAGEAHINGGFDFALARYDVDGALDASFGTGGRTTVNLSGGSFADRARSVAVQPDGRIVAAGGALIATATSGSFNFALVRLASDGTRDRGFGTNGIVTSDFAGFNDFAYAMAIRADEKIVAVGQAGLSFTDVGFAIARYNSDGTPDVTFGFGGGLIVDFAASPDLAGSVAVQKDGKVVAAGLAVVFGVPRFSLARFQ
jgi:uncharacterized delta-60 repeat protein